MWQRRREVEPRVLRLWLQRTSTCKTSSEGEEVVCEHVGVSTHACVCPCTSEYTNLGTYMCEGGHVKEMEREGERGKKRGEGGRIC